MISAFPSLAFASPAGTYPPFLTRLSVTPARFNPSFVCVWLSLCSLWKLCVGSEFAIRFECELPRRASSGM